MVHLNGLRKLTKGPQKSFANLANFCRCKNANFFIVFGNAKIHGFRYYRRAKNCYSVGVTHCHSSSSRRTWRKILPELCSSRHMSEVPTESKRARSWERIIISRSWSLKPTKPENSTSLSRVRSRTSWAAGEAIEELSEWNLLSVSSHLAVVLPRQPKTFKTKQLP